MPRATKAMSHNYRACTVEPVLHDTRKHHNEDCIPRNSRVAPARRNWTKPEYSNKDSVQPKRNKLILNLVNTEAAQRADWGGLTHQEMKRLP